MISVTSHPYMMKISGIQMTKPTTIIEKSIDRYFLTENHTSTTLI